MKHLPLPKGNVCITKDGIANLLSMGKMVKEGYRVTMDFDVENAFNVLNEDGSYIKFVCLQDGLYCVNLNDSSEYINYLTTVFEQKNHFSDIENKKVDLARSIQKCMCLLSDIDFTKSIDKGKESRSVGLIVVT